MQATVLKHPSKLIYRLCWGLKKSLQGDIELNELLPVVKEYFERVRTSRECAA
jgi:hypothetical protein